MKTKKRLLPALVLSAFATFAAPQAANAAQFSNVYVFGDSLSDAGSYRPALAGLGIPAALIPILGRFTTNPGPVWSELVAQYYGVTPAASNAGGTIYAQGGARVALTPGINILPGATDRPVSTQITEFLARSGGTADPNALYAVWAGANDLFANLGALQAGAISAAQLQANVLGAATAEIQQIARLVSAGARYIVVFNLPDVGATPAFASGATSGTITQLAAGYNTTLFSGLAGAGIRVIPVDAFALLSEIRANPSAYGFTNITSPGCGLFPPITTAATGPSSQFCYPANYVTPNAAETYLFADGVHPTTAAHRIVAQFVEGLIEGPTAYSLMAEAPLRTRASHVRTLNEGLVSGQLAEMRRITAFAAGDGADFDVQGGGGQQGLKSTNKSITVGLTARASEAVTVGLGYGESRSNGSLGGEMGGFRTKDRNWSAFASMKTSGFYANGIVTIADIRFDDVRRNIRLGPVTRVATSSPDGSNASAYFSAGYDFSFGRLKLGPIGSITSQNVEINSFDEEGAGSANLRISSQKRRSEVWSGGLRASFELNGGWTPWATITADKERRDDLRYVTATPLSLATQNGYDIPAYAPDSSYTTAAIGIRGWITPSVGLSFAYFKVSGRSGISEDGLTGLVSVRF